MTLSSPELTPRPNGLIAWLIGFAMLALLAVIAQGPRRSLGQFFDLSGNLRLVSRAIQRVRLSARLVPALLGATVIVWSVWQLSYYSRTERLDDLILLRKTRSTTELALDQGSLAALTPWRDLAALADNMVLLLAAAVITFKRAAERWGEARPLSDPARPVSSWATVGWFFAWLYVLYLMGGVLGRTNGLPPGGCIIVEAALVPFIMVLTDALLLAWVVVEVRNASLALGDSSGIDVQGTLELLPGAVLVCLTALPGRYATAAAWLLFGHIPVFVAQSGLSVFLQGWGVVVLQAVALLFFGLAGGLAWGRGSWKATLKGYGRLLRAEGGRVLAIAVATGILCGLCSAAAYVLLFSLPASTWLLAAADSYAHYATLPIALVALACLIDLGERSLPVATLAGQKNLKG
jgi:hypothetical protein